MPIVRDDPEHPDPAFAELFARLPPPASLEPWLGWVRSSRPPVLYLGIGAGRLAGPLAAAGIQLVGVDAHPGMLARLHERMPGIPTVQSRIEDLRLRRRFDLVMAPSGLLATAGLLAHAARHLAPGGRLAFELMNPHWLKAGAHPMVRVMEFNDARARIEVDYELPDQPTVTQVADVALVWPEKLEDWLASAGLRLERMFGSTDELASSPTFYVLAGRRGVAG